MKMEVFSVYDEKAVAYATPFFMSNTAQAVRAFSDVACDPSTMIAKHSSDYSLYRIGEYDDQSGCILSYVPVFICKAVEFKKEIPSVTE